MKDAEIVKLFLDCRRYAGQLLEVVGDAARAGQLFESEISDRWRGRHAFDHRLLSGASIDAHFALCARNTVDRRLGDQIAIERDGAAGVVIAWHDVSDADRI